MRREEDCWQVSSRLADPVLCSIMLLSWGSWVLCCNREGVFQEDVDQKGKVEKYSLNSFIGSNPVFAAIKRYQIQLSGPFSLLYSRILRLLIFLMSGFMPGMCYVSISSGHCSFSKEVFSSSSVDCISVTVALRICAELGSSSVLIMMLNKDWWRPGFKSLFCHKAEHSLSIP